jgi:predicted Zn-dependent peptidase
LISGDSNNPYEVIEKLKEEIRKFKQDGLNEEDFLRTKKMIYGEYIKAYNDVTDIARMFLSDFMKGLNSFDYIEEIENIDINYATQVLKNEFLEGKMVLSVVK